MLAAMQAEPGDQVSVTETVTGVTAARLRINGAAFDVSGYNWLTCTWATAPAIVSDAFILDDSDLGVLDTDVLGYL